MEKGVFHLLDTDLVLHISKGISKLGSSIPSVNLPPVKTCRANAPCAKKCYARKGRFAFSRTKSNMQENLDLWKTNPGLFEKNVIQAAFCSRFFRWHSSGDMPDENYFHMVIRVARFLPHTSFLIFTKKYEIVNTYLEDPSHSIPSNLHIVLSAWGSFLPENPYHFPVSYVRLKKGSCFIPEEARKCSGYCGECVYSGESCWDLKEGESVVFDEH